MITQEWLSGYIYYENLVNKLEDEKKEAIADAAWKTSNRREMAVQQSRGNGSETRNVKYVDKIDRLTRQIEEIREEMQKIIDAIKTVQSPRSRSLLQLKYIEGKSWEAVAEVLGVCEKWAREELNSRAVRELERGIKKTGSFPV